MTMKKFFTTVLALTLVLGALLSLSACGNKLTMDKIGKRLTEKGITYYTEEGEANEWEEEVEEELGETVSVKTVYRFVVLDDGYVIEFETEEDAEISVRMFQEFAQDEEEFTFRREGKIIAYGERDTVNDIMRVD